MSRLKPSFAGGKSQPRRELRADFTTYTMRHAAVAKQRLARKQQYTTLLKGFSMKSNQLLRTVPGAAVAVAVAIAMTGGAAYALNNWFGGDVSVKQDATVLSVDLSSCKGGLPAGVASGADRHNVQFKLLGDTHISRDDLQRELLAQCELDAVHDFYRGTAVAASATSRSATVTAINADGSFVMSYHFGNTTHEKTLKLSADGTVYDQGKSVTVKDIHVGDNVVFFAGTTPAGGLDESTDPLDAISEVKSIFKTQYDTNDAPDAYKKGFYEQSNIMPLDEYDSLHTAPKN